MNLNAVTKKIIIATMPPFEIVSPFYQPSITKKYTKTLLRQYRMAYDIKKKLKCFGCGFCKKYSTALTQ